MKGRKLKDWSGDPAECAYCLGPNDRQHHRNHNGTLSTRCSNCIGAEAPPPSMLSPAERERIAAMLAKPTWERAAS
jgi:hypothetical protein